MAEPSGHEVRLANLESNYSRSADGMQRIAVANEKTHKAVSVLNRTLIGYVNGDKNRYVKGYIPVTDERLGALEKRQTDCLDRQDRARKSKKGRIVQALTVCRDVAVFLICGYLAVKFGFK